MGELASFRLQKVLSEQRSMKGLTFCTFGAGVASAFLDPSRISGHSLPVGTRLLCKISWLKEELNRFQTAKEMLKTQASAFEVLDACPYFGCWLIHSLPPDALCYGFDLQGKLFDRQKNDQTAQGAGRACLQRFVV